MHALAAEQLKEGEHINLSNLAWNAWNVVWGLSNLQIQGSWFDFILYLDPNLAVETTEVSEKIFFDAFTSSKLHFWAFKIQNSLL